MNNQEIIISILSFVLNSVLFSGFIIPQTQKLKEIKDQIFKFPITEVPLSGVSGIKEGELQEKQQRDIDKLQNLFDSYAIRSKELNSLVTLFWVSILTAIAAVILVLFYSKTLPYLPAVHFVLQLIYLMFAVKIYAISPNRLQDATYLVQELSLNPHSLINALDLKLSYASDKLIAGNPTKEDPLTITLHLGLQVHGFQFIYIISGENNKVYYVSFGPIAQSSQFWRYMLPFNKSGRSEYHWINLGKFQFNLVNNEKKLNITMLILLPLGTKKDGHNPMVTHQEFSLSRDPEGITTASTGGGRPIGLVNTEPTVVYWGQGVKLNDIKYVGKDPDAVLSKVIKKYKNQIVRTRKIKQLYKINGDLCDE